MSKPEVVSMLILSTGHLTMTTRSWMLGLDFEKEGPSGGRVNYGWLIYAHDERISLGKPGEPNGDLPEDLWSCMKKARAFGCTYIKFDCDGDPLEDLNYYGDSDDIQED